MKERIVRFGPDSSLIGIVTEPPVGAKRDGPAVVFLNSGLLHRVGGSRMHVRMARALAETGVVCLRFDYSGLGDSEPRKDALPFEQSGVIETREAMDYLARARGATDFALVGLCSGADMAFFTAIDDARVSAIFQIDPFDYKTPRFYLHRYGPKVFSLRPWLNVLSGHSYVWPWLKTRLGLSNASGNDAALADLVQSPYARAFPPRDTVAKGLRALTARGVRIYAYFTGGRDHSYQGQFADAFGDVDFGGCLVEEYREEADHLVSDLTLQRALDGNLAKWVSSIGVGDVGRERAAQSV